MGKKIFGDLFRSAGEFCDALENVINEGDDTQNTGIGRLLNSIGGVTDSVENIMEEVSEDQYPEDNEIKYIEE